VNLWLWCAAALMLALVPCLLVAARAAHEDALLALQLASTVTTVALLALSQGLVRPVYGTLALTLSILSFVGSLTFIRFMERHV